MLKDEFTIEKIEEAYKASISEYVSVCPDIERITQGIDDLCDLVDSDLVQNCVGLENGFKEKCAEIKKIKLMIRKACAPKTFSEKETQMTTEPTVFTSIRSKTINNFVEKPFVKEKVVEKIVYKNVVNEVIQVEQTTVDKVVEVESTQIKEVKKEIPIDVVTTQIKEVPKVVEKEVINEKHVIKEVEKVVDVVKTEVKEIVKEKIVEKPVINIVEQIKTIKIPQERIKEIIKVVEVPVVHERIQYVDKEVEKVFTQV